MQRDKLGRLWMVVLLSAPCTGWSTSPEAMTWLEHESGPGTQDLAMGGALAPLAEDWTAAWHNPAALAWRHRVEFNVGLEAKGRREERRVSTDGRVGLGTGSASTLGHAGYAHPLPALRGGLCWAVGWERQAQVEAHSDFPDGSWRVREEWFGHEDVWLLSLASQWTPSLAAGISVAFHQQELERLDREEDAASGEAWSAHHRSTLEGLSARLALAHRQGPLHLSLLVEPANSLTVDYRMTETLRQPDTTPQLWREHSGYDVRRPLLVDVGVGWRTREWQLACAWDWQDWSALRYEDLPDGLDLALNQDDLARAFTPRQRLRLGAEWTLPATELRLRGGVRISQGGLSSQTMTGESSDGTPFTYWEYGADSRRVAWSAGLSHLMEERVALDLAVERESWRQHWLEWATPQERSEIRQKVSRWKVRLGLLYRL